jgi:hypothetical protein
MPIARGIYRPRRWICQLCATVAPAVSTGLNLSADGMRGRQSPRSTRAHPTGSATRAGVGAVANSAAPPIRASSGARRLLQCIKVRISAAPADVADRPAFPTVAAADVQTAERSLGKQRFVRLLRRRLCRVSHCSRPQLRAQTTTISHRPSFFGAVVVHLLQNGGTMRGYGRLWGIWRERE